MKKQTIAIDIDDVLADHAATFIAWSNKNYGTNLNKETYTYKWQKFWSVEEEEVLRRASEFHIPKNTAAYRTIHGAQAALNALKQDYQLVVVTARPKAMLKTTQLWLDENFSGMFDEVHFVPIWEPKNTITKSDICRQINAEYLVDDVAQHCNIAAEGGIKALLFGDYAWNRSEAIDKAVVRVKDWKAVMEYFDARY